MNTHPSELCHF